MDVPKSDVSPWESQVEGYFCSFIPFRILMSVHNNHIDDVRWVQRILIDAGGTLNTQKRRFFKICLDYVGHFICPKCIEVRIRTFHAIFWIKQPTNGTKHRQFLCFCADSRRLVLNLSILHPCWMRGLVKVHCNRLKDPSTMNQLPQRRWKRNLWNSV